MFAHVDGTVRFVYEPLVAVAALVGSLSCMAHFMTYDGSFYFKPLVTELAAVWFRVLVCFFVVFTVTFAVKLLVTIQALVRLFTGVNSLMDYAS